jgi:hypothetical protein
MAVKLMDYLEFEPFNSMREKMEASELGFFEIFNPLYHLTGIERSELEREGMALPPHQLSYLLDFTLVYKNTRVAVLDAHCFHVAFCTSFPEQDTLNITTDSQLSNASSVCDACLARLHYKGYEPLKARKEAYSAQVLSSFSLTQFWKEFPIYPVSEKRDIRKTIK